MRKILPFFGIILGLSAALYTNSVGATEYECVPTEGFRWKHGKMVPFKSRYREVYTLDDETGKITTDVKGGYMTTEQYQIMQKLSPGNDLIALRIDSPNGKFIASTEFRIRTWDKSVGIVFWAGGGGGYSLGKCTVKSSDND